MLSSLFRSRREQSGAHKVPEDTRIYAVGDVHGRIDLLSKMHDLISDDAAESEIARKVLVYLGDYIDRGNNSSEVIDFLLDQFIPGVDVVHLSGNHEEIMLAFLEDPSFGPNWIANGGAATLHSYGVSGSRVSGKQKYESQREALKEKLPLVHFDFLRSLGLWHIEGDYMFVHAGVRPGLEPDHQYRSDVLWIRDEFLSSNADHGKCIVHGHTISQVVQFKHNRIGVDTGAYATGKLSCLVLEGSQQRVLHT